MKRVIFISSSRLGTGEPELGDALQKAFLETLGKVQPLPDAVICMNTGVRLAAEDPVSIGSLKKLEDAGIAILSCGTCLDYYNLTDNVEVGRVSNMTEIVTILMNADRVITP